MSWNITLSLKRSLLIAVLVFTISCTVVSEDCNRPNIDEIVQTSTCVGYEISAYSVWTEMQCLDNCLRHPYCDKYIFDRQENQTCKLLYTGDIASAPEVVRLTKVNGKCASKSPKGFQDFLFGTKGCQELHRNDESNIMPRDNNVNGGK